MFVSIHTSNPIIRASLSSWAELTTPEAFAWYQETAIKLYRLVVTLATGAIALGRTVRVMLSPKPAQTNQPTSPMLIMPELIRNNCQMKCEKIYQADPHLLAGRGGDYLETLGDEFDSIDTTKVDKDNILDHLMSQLAEIKQPLLDPETMTCAELRSHLIARGVVIPRKAKKQQLIEMANQLTCV